MKALNLCVASNNCLQFRISQEIFSPNTKKTKQKNIQSNRLELLTVLLCVGNSEVCNVSKFHKKNQIDATV
jgi:hypothetical protein